MELLAKTCKMEQMNVQRILARGMLIIGGAFWVSMIWGASWVYQGQPFAEAFANAALIAAAILAVFVLGLFYEYLASLVLAAAAVVVVVWGIVAGWETGVWATVAFVVLLPVIISSVLYSAAARMQHICTLDGV